MLAARWFLCICILSLFAGAACAGEPAEHLREPGQERPNLLEKLRPGSLEDESDAHALDDFTDDGIKTLLADRLFTQIFPDLDSPKSKGVTLDFSDRFSLIAQYAGYGHACTNGE